ncbi:glycosyl hydrolase family 92-domain-containing protein [Boletus edulis]|nr:glycosyl hydrolase family 92-domain-containing protein [Boletus edulis]
MANLSRKQQRARALRGVEKRDRIKLVGATKELIRGSSIPSNALTNKRSTESITMTIPFISYFGYSVLSLDTYRAEWGMAYPRREWYRGGWLPMWKNIIGEIVFTLIGFTGFDLDATWNAVYKDATVPPINDTTTSYSDREEFVDYEVRAGLSSVHEQKGWVADDIHFESASRTLDCSSESVAQVKPTLRSPCFSENTLFTIFNPATGFMEARNASGLGQIKRKGGNKSFVGFLDEHFDGGHNDHTNEVMSSHHIPYLFSLASAVSKSQTRIRQIAESDYNVIVNGGLNVQNEECGQMSAWYLFSALEFYPVNPVSGEYVVGSLDRPAVVEQEAGNYFPWSAV